MSSFSDDDDDLLSTILLEEIEAQESSKDNSKTSINGDLVNKDDDDDDVMIIDDHLPCQPQVEAVPGTSKQLLANRGNTVGTTKKGKWEAEWSDFVKWFRTQQAFESPWFQSIPITGLNLSQCKTLIVTCKDWMHLVQFADILFGFLKESIENQDPCTCDVLCLIETLFNRVLKDQEEGGSNFSESQTTSQRSQLSNILEEILKGYITGTLTLDSTRLPQLLVSLLPNALNKILCETIKTKNLNLLLPVCDNSPQNFLKVMKSLQLNDGLFEDDPDFQSSSNKYEFATNLLSLLEQKLGAAAIVKLVPSQLQPIFFFDLVISSQNISKEKNKQVYNELFCILNDLFSTFDLDCTEQREFVEFMLKLLPFATSFLSDRKLVKTVRYTKHAYLFMYLKNFM